MAKKPAPKTDSQIEHDIGVGDVHVLDSPFNPAFDQPAERGVVEDRMNIVDLAGA